MSEINNKELFLSMIKNPMIKYCTEERILPSVFAAIAIKSSDYGNNISTVYSYNLFNLTIGNNWYIKCYNVEDNKIYNSKYECDTPGAILIRAYNSYSESISDYIQYIMSYKRGNGPYKYSNIKNCTEYKEVINKLVRSGFMQDQFYIVDDIKEIQELIAIIEENHLYEWDNQLKLLIEEDTQKMSKKRRYNFTNTQNTTNEEVENITEFEEEIKVETENISNIYRVRSNWEDSASQIFASPDPELALEEAKSHAGYKVYINDDGELYADPWEEKEETIEENLESSTYKGLIIPVTGSKIVLKREPVYLTPVSEKPCKYATGIYYFYDYGTYGKNKSRAKITENANILNDKNKNPKMIYGYINIK